MTGPTIAIGLFVASLIGLPFALAAMFTGSDADDADDALAERLLAGDTRQADALVSSFHADDR